MSRWSAPGPPPTRCSTPSAWARAPAIRSPSWSSRQRTALIYRLSGDRNPLHSDPGFAARGGFDRPILHGLCTYGFTGRALLHAVCGGDPARFRAMSGRFTHPVLPGERLVVSIWLPADGGGEALFQAATGEGTVVIDRGRIHFRG